MNIIECDKVAFVKNGNTILQNVSFVVGEGDIVGITGPSGSGKSSLLRLVNLLQSPTKGNIFYKGKNILDYNPMLLRREIGYVLQKPYIFAGTVYENLVYSYTVRNLQPDKAEMLAFMDKVNLTPDFLDKKRNEMSGGEQQRVAFVRSLLVKPEVLLLDEITAALDEANTEILENFIRQQTETKNITIIFITHNIEQLRRLAQNVICIKDGQIDFQGTAQKYFSSREQ
ncbi:ATP-binding cassette domain-containing protein [Pectinatus frisingensis]|uniref:ABC transporter ATP-binding protein n=1 Tax=Pectinatus frisingensis TaxID=865 RepID=UPI0018C77D5E